MKKVAETSAEVIAAFPNISDPTKADEYKVQIARDFEAFGAVSSKLDAALTTMITQARTAAEQNATDLTNTQN